jgi:hypothetical protein
MRSPVPLLIVLTLGCPKRGDQEADPVAALVATADTAWEARGDAGFGPVQEALDQAYAANPADPRVLWRLSRLEVGLGLATDDPREALRSYARARTIALDCLDAGAVLQRAPNAAQADELLEERLARGEAECVEWAAFSWVRWMEAFGPEASAIDLAALDLLVERAEVVRTDPALFDWTRGLLAAIRPEEQGRDLDAGRRWLTQAADARPEELAVRADLIWTVGLPARDGELVDAQIQALETRTPRTPEDHRALARISALQGRTEQLQVP